MKHTETFETLWVKDGTMCQARETEEYSELEGFQAGGVRLEQVSNRETLRYQIFLTADDATKLYYYLSRTSAIQESNVQQLIDSERAQHARLAAQHADDPLHARLDALAAWERAKAQSTEEETA